jgi:CheY-like chemotaxis protein
MENSMSPKPVSDRRRELEDLWRSKLEGSRRCYDGATEEYRKLLQEAPEGVAPVPGSPLARARQKQSEALAEYARVLGVFTDLAVHGRQPEEEQKPNLVAVIDDDKSVRNSVKTLLRSAGYRVETFESAETFLASGAAAETGCLILDVRMPGMDGVQLQVHLNREKSRLPIIFITGHDDGTLRERLIQAGAVEMLPKPFAPNALLATVQMVLSRKEQS